MTHYDAVQNYAGTLTELAGDIGDLRYDALVEFLTLLSAKLALDAEKDAARGRARLAAALQNGAAELSAAAQIESAWRIAKPFMPGAEPEAAEG